MDEFEQIARLFRPLTLGAPEALDLLDDAAVIPSRAGYDLIVTKDAIVEGVHFLPGDRPDLVARKLLRVNLSDLAAKGAEPYAYLLALAWPAAWDEAARMGFAKGLAQDQAAFGLKLLGGDTVSTPGPFTASATLLGWSPAGAVVKRSGARSGDIVLVSGTIGDGGLGLEAAQEGLADLAGPAREYLADRYWLPQPRVELRAVLRRHASAAADVSDGLLADAGHLAEASGAGLEIRLEDVPLSPAARAWMTTQPDPVAARLRLATAGDDYEVVCTARPKEVDPFKAAAEAAGVALNEIGRVTPRPGVVALFQGDVIEAGRTGWRHG